MLFMRIPWNELTAGFERPAVNGLLADWRWLLGNSMDLPVISSLGDMFLSDATGKVFWLDAGAGKRQQVAANHLEFTQLIQKPENADRWLVPSLVGDLITSGVGLSAGQCYRFINPPILGGPIAPANFKPVDLSVHFSVLGQINRQVRDLPPGTKISNVKFA
jgi:hypothetical protein